MSMYATRRNATMRTATRAGYSTTLRAIAVLSMAAICLPAGALEFSLYNQPTAWTDDSGQTFTFDSLKGKKALVTMAFSTCRKVCSVTLKKLEELQGEIDRKNLQTDIVIVSYDPLNDNPKSWAEYRKQHGLNRPNWHFLTGTAKDTKSMSRMLGLGDYWSLEGHVLHDFKISVLNENGVIVRQLGWQDLKTQGLL